MLKGECNCGQVQFQIDAMPAGVIICHCSICRRHTGTNGNAVVLLKNDNFQWISGQEHISTWKKPKHDWQIWFCKTCGSQVPGKNDENMIFAPAGALTEGGEDLKVIHHIWVESKANWDEIGATGQQHTKHFGA